jgi:3-oxoadipate enol-lactonase
MSSQEKGMQKARVNGVELAYRFDGPGAGRVVMLSNSLMTDHRMWDGTLPALTDRYRVLRYDTRGHGQSGTTPGPYSIEALADDAVGLLDALGLSRVHFTGLSMGGMIAQQLGARYPERVLSLGLCDTASEMPPRSIWEERFAVARTEGTLGLADSTIQRWFTAPFIAKAPGEVEKVRQMILGTGKEGYIACGSAVRDMAQTTMLLKITAPTLVLVGRKDPSCSVEKATVLHRMIAHSEMVVLEEAAHLSNIEQPQAFNRALRFFLDRVEEMIGGAT